MDQTGTDQSAYEYRGLKAATWDLLHCEAPEWSDRDFYSRVIARSGEPVLDVGCGTGRLLLDYLAQGIDIDGVDISPEMLQLCWAKARQTKVTPRLFQQPMQSLDLPRRYRTILVPSSSFQLLVDPADACAALCCFSRHLEPGGTLVLPFVVICKDQPGTDIVVEDWKCVREKLQASDGLLVRLWSRRVFDLRERLEHVQERLEVLRDGRILSIEEYTRSPATRWYTQQGARDLFTGAGFTAIRLVRSFSFRRASTADALFCVLGTSPSNGSRRSAITS